MKTWHQTPDADCHKEFQGGAWWLNLEIGSWPIEPGQSIVVMANAGRDDGTPSAPISLEAVWQHNRGANSYWWATLGPFRAGDTVEYSINAKIGQEHLPPQVFLAHVGPKLLLALFWHQHQPLYRNLTQAAVKGSLTQPWVRLHAIRDYYSMAAMLSDHPRVHLTINLTPVLLLQLDAYTKEGCSDLQSKNIRFSPRPFVHQDRMPGWAVMEHQRMERRAANRLIAESRRHGRLEQLLHDFGSF